MTDKALEAARQIVAANQTNGNRHAIAAGDWDNGSLVRDALASVLRERVEAEGE